MLAVPSPGHASLGGGQPTPAFMLPCADADRARAEIQRLESTVSFLQRSVAQEANEKQATAAALASADAAYDALKSEFQRALDSHDLELQTVRAQADAATSMKAAEARRPCGLRHAATPAPTVPTLFP